MTERDVVALTLYGEARGEPLEGQLAVASVLLNRKAYGRWGRTFVQVCLAKRQFSCWNEKDPNEALLNRIAADIEGHAAIDAALRRCLWLADGVVAGLVPSTVGASTHYVVAKLSPRPTWAKTGHLVATIGRHAFYSRVA